MEMFMAQSSSSKGTRDVTMAICTYFKVCNMKTNINIY